MIAKLFLKSSGKEANKNKEKEETEKEMISIHNKLNLTIWKQKDSWFILDSVTGNIGLYWDSSQLCKVFYGCDITLSSAQALTTTPKSKALFYTLYGSFLAHRNKNKKTRRGA